jgi:hypothetical protein
MAFAQAGTVGAFADAGATNCNLVDAGGLVVVYINQVYTTGSTAAQFMLVPAPGWAHLGDNWNFQAIGTALTGVSVAYGQCFAGTISLGWVNFFGAGVPPCTFVSIVPDPAAPTGQIEAVDCEVVPAKMFPTGGVAIVNPLITCDCLIPVQDTTWGGIKALYQ